MRKGIIAGVEIFLLVFASIAFSYMVSAADEKVESIENKGLTYQESFATVMEFIGNIIFSNMQSVSALVYTCPLSKNGTVCQMFDSSNCQQNCNVACIPSASSTVGDCAIGTCYTSDGNCAAGSPKWACKDSSGTWYSDPSAGANIVDSSGNLICKKQCCALGSNAYFITERQCNIMANRTALQAIVSYPDNENDCLNSIRGQEKGACVYTSDYENTCRFTTRDECRLMGGAFSFNLLCSNPSLNSSCMKQNTTGCIDGTDEIYWFDSCGNKENIYNANRDASWNNGIVLPKSQSCSVAVGSNNLANQGTCGNCNYIQGSKCGMKSASEKLADSNQESVCRDLNCIDENGAKRANGESWCLYDGTIGGGKDIVGSRYYRRVCQDGEVITEPCADFRNEVCVSGTNDLNGTVIKTASCRINRWQECLEANQNGDASACKANPDCLVKSINVDENFAFDACVPKYTEGFDLGSLVGRSSFEIGLYGSASYSQQICAAATQTCTMVETKELDGEWECKSGCNCAKPVFEQQMSDYCTALGDCGMKANWVGDVTYNYDVKKKGVSQGRMLDKNTAKQYALPKAGQSISDAGGTGINDSDFANRAEAASLRTLGEQDYDTENPYSMYSTVSTVAGGAAGMAAMAGFGGTAAVAGTAAAPVALSAGSTFVAGAGGATLTTATGTVSLAAGQSAVIGPATTMVGSGSTMTPLAAFLAPLMPFLIAIAILAIAFMIYTTVIGWGKSRVTKFQFVCQPWTAPVGGAKCGVCDNNPIKPCSKYRCESLGGSCAFLNEGTGNETCVALSRNDASAPVIKPNYASLLPGYKYTNVNNNGYKLESSEGCIKEFTPAMFGISLNEPGRCRFDVNHTTKFENMRELFGEQNIFLQNHSMAMILPSLESLGIFGSNPNRIGTYNIYVRCEDAMGNRNTNEYNINFCVKPMEDHTAPAVSGVQPILAYIANNASSRNTTIFINEPAQCKWDSTDTSYDSMANLFNCATSYEDFSANGWACRTNFPTPLNSGNSSIYSFYIRCKDQPWLEENDTKRNINAESVRIDLIRSDELKISSITPSSTTIYISQIPSSIELNAVTSGGIEGTVCFFKVGENYVPFANEEGNNHKQVFTSLGEGEQIFPIRCTDLAGNIAYGESKFNVEVDTNPPIVTRVYNSNGLVLVTNEDSICSYTNSIGGAYCDFTDRNVTTMTGAGVSHTSILDRKLTYYIKCKDQFNNQPNGCSIVVQGGML